jgi:hypothetical protein
VVCGGGGVQQGLFTAPRAKLAEWLAVVGAHRGKHGAIWGDGISRLVHGFQFDLRPDWLVPRGVDTPTSTTW